MFIKVHFIKYLLILCYFFGSAAFASDIDIVKVVLTKQSGTWRADVTIKHNDTGWKHYVDAWRLVDEKGNEISKRTLYHPHVNEQPFTRSLNSFHIPKDKKILYVEAHDLNRGWDTKKIMIDMRKPSSAKYKINIR